MDICEPCATHIEDHSVTNKTHYYQCPWRGLPYPTYSEEIPRNTINEFRRKLDQTKASHELVISSQYYQDQSQSHQHRTQTRLC